MELSSDDFCFVCGRDNPRGLHLEPEGRDGRCSFTWTPGQEFQGWSGIVHGGIIAALLDEAMAYAAMSTGGRHATAEMSLRFHRPVSTGEPLDVEGTVEIVRGRVDLTSAVLSQGGVRCASATARFVRTDA